MSYTPSYPIGKFEIPTSITATQRLAWINTIEQFPHELESLVEHLTEEQLKRQYRTDSWTIQEIVHHLADSHMNGLIRHKLALTEDNPTIKGYEQDGWALLPDVRRTKVVYSLAILKGVHYRWSILLRSLKAEQHERTYYHPEWNHNFTLDESLAQYAWHSKHHLAHIKLALK
jgi:hypothetical protein